MSQQFIDEVRGLHNHICILHDMELVRVIGIHFDAMDAYYKVRSMSHYGQPPVDKMSTMVGHCDSLKGVLPRYEHTDDLFAMNGCPPTELFTVTADSRQQFGLLCGDQALEYFDTTIAPLLAANGGTSQDDGICPAEQVREAFAKFYPEHADTVRPLLWMGRQNDLDRFRHLGVRSGFDFNRETGEVFGDLESGETQDIALIMRELAV